MSTYITANTAIKIATSKKTDSKLRYWSRALPANTNAKQIATS